MEMSPHFLKNQRRGGSRGAGTAAPLSGQWSPNLGDVGQKLNDMQAALMATVRRALLGNAALMRDELKTTTPRSEVPGPHVADGWSTRTLTDTPGLIAVEVYNADPRWDEPIPVKGGGSTSLGMIIEFGSKPHEISAVRAKALSFFWPAVGQVVSMKTVYHPGTAPTFVLGAASERAMAKAATVINAAAKIARETFGGGA